MDVAPAAAEEAVVTGAVVQGAWCSSMQQRWRGCSSKQRALVELQAAADRGTIAMDGRQPACMRQWAADVVCVQQRAVERHVCDSVQRQRAGGSSQQHYCNGRQWWQPVEVAAQRAEVDSYSLLTCGIFTQALCTRWFLEVHQRYILCSFQMYSSYYLTKNWYDMTNIQSQNNTIIRELVR